MPIPTSSMYPNQNPRRQLARQLWSDFRLYAGKARQVMITRRNKALQDANREGLTAGRTQQERDQQKAEIAKAHETEYFLEMRVEWQRILHSNGLQHEDWGEVTPQEMAVIRQVLGPDELEAEEEDNQNENGGDSYNHPPADFVPVNVAPQPLSQSVSHQSQSSYSSFSSISSNHSHYTAPSLPSRSQNTSSASYAFVDPRQFTDDERDDFSSPYLPHKGHGYGVGSEDEDGGIPVPNHKFRAHTSQQHSSGYTTNWSSSNQSSLSSSPADATSHSFRQPSSLSSSSHFPPHVPSSLSKSVLADDDPDRIFTAAMNATTSSFAAAAAPKPKSKLRSGYIGPQLTTNDSENEADADFASMSKADQIAAYEKFKWEVRVQKIREFHDEAAEYGIEVARKLNGGPDSSLSTGGYDKAWVAQVVAQHERDMLVLRSRKEEERKQLVRNERNRMKAEIEKGQAGAAVASTTTRAKKEWGTPPTTTTAPRKNGFPSTTTTASSFSAFTSADKTPVIPAANKPKTPATSSASAVGAAPGPLNLDALQNVFSSAPSVEFETAFQISQLLGAAEDDSPYNQPHGQEWRTPQLNHTPNNFPSASAAAAAAAGGRKRTDSISVLDEGRFSTISAKSTKQRRGTITVSTTAATNEPGFWKPQGQPPSPEESQALTDQYAKFLLGEASTTRTGASRAAVHQEEDDDWVGWGSKPASASISKANGGKTNTASTSTSGSAWTTKKTAPAAGSSSPAMTTPNGWGAGVKKTFGFGSGNTNSAWSQEGGQENEGSEEFEEVEDGEEEEEEGSNRPSPFGVQKKPSLLSDMMAKGKNAVAGAVGAALGPMGMNPSAQTTPRVPPSGPAKKNGAHTTAATSSPLAQSMTAAAAGKKVPTKKGRQAANKKATLMSLMDQDEAEGAQGTEPQPPLTTPKAAASSTKFTSAFGPTNNNPTGFGSPPSRHATSSGGMWDDIVSTTPRPSGLSGVFGSSGTSASSTASGVRKPSGLHRQVWNAEEEDEQEEEQEDEGDTEAAEEEWRMPGSLNASGGFGANAGKSAFGASTGMAVTKKNATKNANSPNPNTHASAWGWSSNSASTTGAAGSRNPKKSSLLSNRHPVTMEEVPDESDEPRNRSPSNILASDSRVILEPKPSKPPVMYDGIIQYGANSASPEDTRRGTMAANQRGAMDQEEEGFDEEWFRKAAMQLRQGTEQGNRLFGDAAPAGATKATPATGNGINIPGRGTNPNVSGGSGLKSNNPWGTSSSFSSSNMVGSMSSSFKDASPLANGPPPKMASSAFGSNMNASRSSLNQVRGAGLPSTPNIGVGIGIGKNVNAKAKSTTGTSTGFGTDGGFSWGAPSSMSGSGAGAGGLFDRDNDAWGNESKQDEDVWGEQKDDNEEQEREEELLRSRKRLQEMFPEPTTSSTKSSGKATITGAGNAVAKARMLREQKEREEREQEEREQERERQEREAREQEEREAQEKAAKEREAKGKEAAAVKPTATKVGGGKKNRGKKR